MFRWQSNNSAFPIVIKSALPELQSAKTLNDTTTLLMLTNGFVWLKEQRESDVKTFDEYIKTLPIPKSLPEEVREAASWQFVENQNGSIRKVQLVVVCNGGNALPRVVAAGSVLFGFRNSEEGSKSIACIGLPDFSKYAASLAVITTAHQAGSQEIDLISAADSLGQSATTLLNSLRVPENEVK